MKFFRFAFFGVGVSSLIVTCSSAAYLHKYQADEQVAKLAWPIILYSNKPAAIRRRALRPGRKAPDFKLLILGNASTADLSKHTGRPVVLVFGNVT